MTIAEQLEVANFQLAHEREINLAVAEKNSALIDYFGTLPSKLEERSTYCFHCGTKLEPHKPAIFEDGKEVGRQETGKKWCPSCLWVISGHVRLILNA